MSANARKTSDRVVLPSEFVKKYEIDTTLTPLQRGMKFLIDWKDVAPGRYMDRRLLARVAFNLGATPSERNEYVYKRLPGLWQRIKEKLMNELQVGWDTDPVDGVRVTYSAQDMHETMQKNNRKRAASAVGRLNRSTEAIDPSDLPAALRLEHNQDVVGTRTLLKGLAQLPALGPASDDKNK
jgi:hypothetical protein